MAVTTTTGRRSLPLLFAVALCAITSSMVVDALAYAPNFVTKIVAASLGQEDGKHDTAFVGEPGSTGIITRFPPEPNGYLHLGHAKALSFNFAVARMFGGKCHLRLDDTNPGKESSEYVSSILEDVEWMRSAASPWSGPVRQTSDFFDLIYRCAESLVLSGDAYVEALTAEEMREYRGSLTEPGKNSPWRDRPVEENLGLLRGMKAGEFQEGTYVLRAKIDMADPNVNLRDPTLYRIRYESHQNTGDAWCLYPLYDFSHPITDAAEGVTHSLCTLEFEDHRPLYDWVLTTLRKNGMQEVEVPAAADGVPRQIEFSRLNVKNTVLSKRKLINLVTSKVVSGWDDPRMPTLSGLRRRGIPPEAIRLFCERVGISKVDSNIDYGDLENCVREVLDDSSPRAFAVLRPLKVTIDNWNGNTLEDFDIPRHPKIKELRTRTVPFGKHLYIERDDFFDTETNGAPPKGFKRLTPNGKVRLKFAYVIECTDVIRDETSNEPIELICKVYPDTRAGVTPEGMAKVKGIVHWVNAKSAVKLTVNSYDRLFKAEEPGKDGRDYLEDLNPNSLETMEGAFVEPSVAMDALEILAQLRHQDSVDERVGIKMYPSALSYQFERLGYFALDKESDTQHLVFNRVVTLRDTWGVPAAAASKKKGKATQNTDEPVRRRGGGGNNGNAQSAPVDDVRRIALRAGTILSAEPHPDAESLLVLSVDCGDVQEDGSAEDPRTVVAGLAGKIATEDLVQKKVVCLTNLKPAKMRGIESRAMLLAAEDDKEEVQLLSLPDSIPNGELLSFEGMETPEPDAMLKSKGAVKVWDRVKAQLKTNEDGEAAYWKDGTDCCRIVTSDGSAVKTSFNNARIG